MTEDFTSENGSFLLVVKLTSSQPMFVNCAFVFVLFFLERELF